MKEIARILEGSLRIDEGDVFVIWVEKKDELIFIRSFLKTHADNPILYISPPLESGKVCLSQLIMTFMLSYFLGMLCRYYPSHWIALSRGNLGDEIWPLMQICISYVEKAFPQLVIETIQRRVETA